MFEVPEPLRRLADRIDGWLDLRCPERALELLEPLLGDPLARPAGLAMRIRARIRLGDHAAALQDLAELQTTHGNVDWVDLTEAWCRKRIGDLAGAIRCASQLVQRNRKCDIGHFNHACYLALAGKTDLAIDALSLACGLNPECRQLAREEPDFDSLRTDPRFRMLLRDGDGVDAAPDAGDDDAEMDDDANGIDDPDLAGPDEHDDDEPDERSDPRVN